MPLFFLFFFPGLPQKSELTMRERMVERLGKGAKASKPDVAGESLENIEAKEREVMTKIEKLETEKAEIETKMSTE